jgi:Ca2+-binding EF-hand superfamily protein
MIGPLLLILATAAQPTGAVVTPARALFERDWVLMNWALKFYDGDHDQLLSADEARAAAEAFRKLADKNGDGRITPEEYRDARAAILSRY